MTIKYIGIFLIGLLVGMLSYGLVFNLISAHNSVHLTDLGISNKTYDLRFLKAMTSHHMGAIEMAKVAVEKSKNEKVLGISKGIIADQEVEIALMNVWKKEWYKDEKDIKLTEYSLMRNLGNYDEKFDLRYLNAMIVHHEGALDMCKDALTKSTRNQVLTICNDILSTQSQEIVQMEMLREELYKVGK